MAYSTLVYYGNNANGTALLALPSVTDQIYRQQGNGYIVDPTLNKLGMAQVISAHSSRGQVDSPTLRQVLNKEIRPVMKGMPTGGQTARVNWFMDQPLQLGANEELDFFEIHGTATEHVFGLVNIQDQPVAPVKGQIFTSLFTGTTTLVADAWTIVPLTADQQLPPGTYDVVGARAESTGIIAFRLVFPGQVARPGGLGSQIADVKDIDQQRYGQSGLWGSFVFNLFPYLEVFSDSADTAENLYLDLIKH